MIKQRGFWLGLTIGLIIGFLYAWLSIWATYTVLEQDSMRRDAELRQVKRTIYYSEDILNQRKETLGWNIQSIMPAPEWVVGEEE